jgi:hypothetical protein
MAATTISRTTWTDDDGSGTTGSIVNNAFLQGLYDQIDALFTGQLTIERTVDGNVLDVSNTDASLAATVLTVHVSRAANSAFNLLACYANSVCQFRVAGNGAVVSTGAFRCGSTVTWSSYVDAPRLSVNGFTLAARTDGTNGVYGELLYNLYYNSGFKFFGKGFAGLYECDPSDGSHYYEATASAGSAQGDAATLATAMKVTRGGNLIATLGIYEYSNTTALGEWTAMTLSNTPPFQTSIFSTSDGGTTWYVDVGGGVAPYEDVTEYRYMIIGHTMFLCVGLGLTSIDSSNAYQLKLKVPASKTIARSFRTPTAQRVDGSGSGRTSTTVAGDAGSTWISIYHDHGSSTTWPSEWNSVGMAFVVFFEIQ